jgi:probable F420-dependent oxidoreductase
MSRPFRFGVISSGAPDGKTWRETARRAEGLGYSTLLVPDHFQEQWGPLVALTVAAEATERLSVGTLVLDNDYRHPVVLAKEIATLDRALEGRVELGIGAGWKRSDYEQSGIAYDRPGIRIERMAEALTIMKALWASDKPVNFAGKHYQMAGVVGTPRPHTERGPSVCIGGGGRRMLTLAAQAGDIVAVNVTLTAGGLGAEVTATATPAAFDEKLSWVRTAAGDRFETLELQCHCAFTSVTSDRDAVVGPMASAFGLSSNDALDIPLCLAGTAEQLVETIERRRERWGFTYWIVPDNAMEDFAPVVASLAS